MSDIRTIHGLLGSVTLLVGVFAVFLFAVAWMGKRAYTGFHRGLFGVFAWLLILQGVSGAFYLARFFSSGVELVPSAWAHLGVSALAVTLAQTYRAWTNQSDAEKHRNLCLTALASVALSVFGMMLLGRS